jgi:hypothetical protein
LAHCGRLACPKVARRSSGDARLFPRIFRGAEKVLLQRAKILAVLLRYFFASQSGVAALVRRLISLYARVVVFCTGDCGIELIDLP